MSEKRGQAVRRLRCMGQFGSIIELFAKHGYNQAVFRTTGSICTDRVLLRIGVVLATLQLMLTVSRPALAISRATVVPMSGDAVPCAWQPWLRQH